MNILCLQLLQYEDSLLLMLYAFCYFSWMLFGFWLDENKIFEDSTFFKTDMGNFVDKKSVF